MASKRKDVDLVISPKNGGGLEVKERAMGHRGDTIEWRVRNKSGAKLNNVTFDFNSPFLKANKVSIDDRKTESVSVTVDTLTPNGVYKFTVLVNNVPTLDPELEIEDLRLTKKKKRPIAKKKTAPKKKKKTVRRK